MSRQPALLMLDDGASFSGYACGARQEAHGEVIFTTGMSGYQETITDPSYTGQIITFTSAHIGNYGTSELDDESPVPRAGGIVMHDLFDPGSGDFAQSSGAFLQWRAGEVLDAYLRRHSITGICGVDTRALTLHLREHGARNGIISAADFNPDFLLARAKALPSMQGRDLAATAGCKAAYDYRPSEADLALIRQTQPTRRLLHLPTTNEPEASSDSAEERALCAGVRKPVALIDFGAKRSILLQLFQQNLDVRVFPPTVTAREILDSKVQGVMLSNGPGDPEPCAYAVQTIKGLLGRLPLFGICLGHQLLGLASGAKTYKLAFGHHGLNHPVKDMGTGRVSVTSQNHGFCVDPQTLPENVRITHTNLNDGTVEGMALTDCPAFSVQFHPEAAPGTWDASGLFSRFRKLIDEKPV